MSQAMRAFRSEIEDAMIRQDTVRNVLVLVNEVLGRLV